MRGVELLKHALVHKDHCRRLTHLGLASNGLWQEGVAHLAGMYYCVCAVLALVHDVPLSDTQHG